MKYHTNWRLFFRLLTVSFTTTVLVLPYALALSPGVAALFTPVVATAQLIQSTVLFSIAIYVGLRLAKGLGFELAVWEGKKPISHLKTVMKQSVGLGVLAGVLVLLLSFLFTSLSATFLEAEKGVAWWMGLLASFYGGIGEEIMFRLFLMTLLTWIIEKIRRSSGERPRGTAVWAAILITAVLFGLGHLGITGSMTAITGLVIARAVLLNGVGGVIFGWLYWRKGLEAAMIAHFSADIVLHVLTPLAAGLFW